MPTSWHRHLLVTLFLYGVSGCSDADVDHPANIEGPQEGVLAVGVVNYPLKYFAERIGGPHVHVGCSPDTIG